MHVLHTVYGKMKLDDYNGGDSIISVELMLHFISVMEKS